MNYCKSLADLMSNCKKGYKEIMDACRLADIMSRVGEMIWVQKGDYFVAKEIYWVSQESFITEDNEEYRWGKGYYTSVSDIQKEYELIFFDFDQYKIKIARKIYG